MAVKGRIAVSGATGFVGRGLTDALLRAGYDVAPMVRERTKDPDAIYYDYERRHMELDKLSQCFAVIHLAGRNIMSGLWTPTFKHELYESRVNSTRFIAHSLAKIDGPRILLSTSACGIYGDRADQKLDETSKPGSGFLAKLCTDWERGTLFAKEAGIRVVKMRFGIVLDKEGGMLKKLLPLYSRGLGAMLGDGEQYLSYVTRDELIKMIIYLLENHNISGPVNCVAYEPVTEADFAHALADVLQQKLRLRVPKFLFNALGDQAAMMIASLRVYPKVLLDHHFPFKAHQPIAETLRELVAS